MNRHRRDRTRMLSIGMLLAELRASPKILGTHEQGLIITTSDFAEGARGEAARFNAVPVGLMNDEQLVALLAEYAIGITRRTHDIIELNEQGTVASIGGVA